MKNTSNGSLNEESLEAKLKRLYETERTAARIVDSGETARAKILEDAAGEASAIAGRARDRSTSLSRDARAEAEAELDAKTEKMANDIETQAEKLISTTRTAVREAADFITAQIIEKPER